MALRNPQIKWTQGGGKGILLGQIVSNISLARTKDDKIQHVADGHIDNGKVQLSKERSAFTKPGTSETDEIINPHHNSHDGGVEL